MKRKQTLVGLLAQLLAAATLAARPEIHCPAPDPSPEEIFEPVAEIDGFERPETTWKAVDDGQTATASVTTDRNVKRDGNAALRVDYEFRAEKKLEYINLDTGIRVTAADRAGGVGFWLLDDGTRFAINVRLEDVSGETHQLVAQRAQQPGWHFVALPVQGKSAFWGGDKNGKIDFPAKVRIVFDRPVASYKGKGSLWIDTVTRVRMRQQRPTSLIVEGTPPLGNVYAPKARVDVLAHGAGTSIQWRVHDYFDAVVAQGEGPATNCPVTFTLPAQGYYRCRIDLLKDGRLAETRIFHCAALDAMGVASNAAVGVCSHFCNWYPLEEMDLLTQYGIRHFRDEITWGALEDHKGVYRLPVICSNYLARAQALNLEPFLIYDYGNKLYANAAYPNTEGDIAAFARYAVELTRMTRGLVTSYEVWNEWVGGCAMSGKTNDHSPEAYGRLLKPVYAAVKQAYPAVTVVGMGGEYGEKTAENIERALSTAGGSSMDAFSIHPYRYPSPPETREHPLLEEVGAIFDRSVAKGAPRSMWVTEIGWPTHADPRGVSERTQARYLVRACALLQATGHVQRIYWYDFKDDGLNRQYNEDNFGLVRHQRFNFAPKPGIVALAVFNHITAGARPIRLLRRADVQPDEGHYGVLYRLADGSDCVVAWTANGTAKVAVRGTVTAVRNIMGQPVAATQSVELSEDAIYFFGRGLEL